MNCATAQAGLSEERRSYFHVLQATLNQEQRGGKIEEKCDLLAKQSKGIKQIYSASEVECNIRVKSNLYLKDNFDIWLCEFCTNLQFCPIAATFL